MEKFVCTSVTLAHLHFGFPIAVAAAFVLNEAIEVAILGDGNFLTLFECLL